MVLLIQRKNLGNLREGGSKKPINIITRYLIRDEYGSW